MTREEREVRWKSNYAHISVHTAMMWADHFTTELNETCSGALKGNMMWAEHLCINDAASAFAKAKKRLIVIGYNAALAKSGARNRHAGRNMTDPQLHRARCAPVLAIFCVVLAKSALWHSSENGDTVFRLP